MTRRLLRRETINYTLIVVLTFLSLMFIILLKREENTVITLLLVYALMGIVVLVITEVKYHIKIRLSDSEKLILSILIHFLKEAEVDRNNAENHIMPFFFSYEYQSIKKILDIIYNNKQNEEYLNIVSFNILMNRVYLFFMLINIIENNKLHGNKTKELLEKYSVALTGNLVFLKQFEYYYLSSENNNSNKAQIIKVCISYKLLGLLPGNEEFNYKKAIYKILKRKGLTEKSELYSRLNSFQSNLIYSAPASQTYGKIYEIEYSSYKDILKAEIISNFYFNRYNVTETNIYRYVQQYVSGVTQNDFMQIVNNKKSLKLICELINNSGFNKTEYIDNLFEVAAADKIFSDKEDAYINIVAGFFGIDTREVAKIRNEYLKKGVTEKKTKRKTYKKTSSFSSSVYTFYSSKAYKILGIDKTATADEIKAAYRTLVKKNHPDKFATQGNEAMELAEDRFQVITEAYELIKRLRGIN